MESRTIHIGYPSLTACLTRCLCWIRSNALTRSSSPWPYDVFHKWALSPLAACFQAATVAPFAAPAYRYGLAWTRSQCMTTGRRTRIQMRGSTGRSPMGRHPPSFFGSSTTMTSWMAIGHFPSISQIINRSMSKDNNASSSLSSALGWMPSHPRPEPHGKDMRAPRSSATETGTGMSSHSNSPQSGSIQSSPVAHSPPHLHFSSFACCCAVRGATPWSRSLILSSCSLLKPSTSSIGWSSLGCASATLVGNHPTAVLESWC